MAGDAAVVTWVDDGAVVVGYRMPDGTWDVSEVGQGSRPRVAVNASGDAAATWHRYAGEDALVEVAHRPAGGTWSPATTLSHAGRYPVVAINPAGTVRVLSLRWRGASASRTDVQLFTRTDDWSGPKDVTGPRNVRATPALARSLTIATDSAGRAVLAWMCDAPELGPGARGFVCVDYPGSGYPGGEPMLPAERGKFAISVPGKRPVHLVTPYELSEITPGMLATTGWGGRKPVSQVTLEVGDSGAGVASWQVAGPNSRLWVITRSPRDWRAAVAVSLHTHGLSGTTLAEPETGLAFWRTGGERLQTAVNLGTRAWQRDVVLGSHVEEAKLVSNDTGDALLAWSSADTDAGVYVASWEAINE